MITSWVQRCFEMERRCWLSPGEWPKASSWADDYYCEDDTPDWITVGELLLIQYLRGVM